MVKIQARQPIMYKQKRTAPSTCTQHTCPQHQSLHTTGTRSPRVPRSLGGKLKWKTPPVLLCCGGKMRALFTTRTLWAAQHCVRKRVRHQLRWATCFSVERIKISVREHHGEESTPILLCRRWRDLPADWSALSTTVDKNESEWKLTGPGLSQRFVAAVSGRK